MQPYEFYEVLPDRRWRMRVDHHTLDDFSTCDRFFEFRHMPDQAGQVWATKGLSIKVALGSWWSSVMEHYYEKLRERRLPTEQDIVHIVADAWAEHEMEKYKLSEPENFERFGGLDGAYHMATEYHQAFGQQHFANWEIVGAELGFGLRDELKLGEDLHVVVYYAGRPDLVVLDRTQNMVMPLDFKTRDYVPSNAPALVKPMPQLCGYIYACRHLMRNGVKTQLRENPDDVESWSPKLPTKCVVMFCARLKPSDKPRDGVKKPRFMPVYANYSLEELEEWRRNVVEKCRRMRAAIERGVFVPRESACHLYTHGCVFRRVCSMPANVRDAMLKADFIKKEPWQPYRLEENDE